MKHTVLDTANRLTFHTIFLDWLGSAPDDQTIQLDALMDQHPTTEVRSMITFIRDCLADPQRKVQLPADLLRRLEAVNWPIGEVALQAL